MYEVGDLGRFQATFSDPDTTALVDPPTVQFRYQSPTGPDSTLTYPDPDLQRLSVGRYRASVTLDVAGVWKFGWQTAGTYQGVEEFSRTVQPTIFATADPTSITPSIAEVSTLLYDMIVKEGGQIGEEFDDSTSPTGGQAQFFIAKAVTEMLGRLQVSVPAVPVVIDLAKWVVTIHAARLIVRFFNTERTTDAASTTSLDTMFESVWPDLVQACRAPAAVRLS